jgi:uroporphyrin-III C-methyltransferase
MNDPRASDPRDEQERASSDSSQGGADDTRIPAAEPVTTDVPRGGETSPGPASAAATPPASTTRSLGVVLGFFALLVAFAAAGGVVFTWWQVTEQMEAEAGRNAAAAETLSDIREVVASTQERVAAQEEQVGTLNRDAEERRRRVEEMDAELHQARARLEAMAQEESGPERTPALAEIEFLLLLAGRELTLADNPRVALAALREADQRVARMDDPGMGEVRAAINDEITAVEAVAAIDLEGIALRLASLARRVDGLPLRAATGPGERHAMDPAPEEAAGWNRLVGRMRAAAADLFRVRRTETRAAPLLAPEEAFFLYRNVELDLKSARLAVLARDRENYAASLESARESLSEYFDTSDEAVRSLITSIQSLEQSEIAPRWPEISRSLALLRATGANN